MTTKAKTLGELVREVPPESNEELRRYVEFLIARPRRQRGEPRFDWAGALKDMRDRYTSVELQHEISRWRSRGE